MYFTVLQQLCVYIITWNVNTQYPNSGLSIDNILGIENNNTCGGNGAPDLYVIGLQEVNSKPESIVSRLYEDNVWITKFRNVLSSNDYVIIKNEQMLGLLMIVFTKRKHLLNLKYIESEKTRRGFGGFWGNKGAISIRMNLYGSSITFVNAHLPAHDDQLNKRIDDYNHIINNHHYHVNHYRNIFDHDYVFWFGDLNFRLTDTSLRAENIRYLIENNQLNELFERDQLNLVRREGIAFQQFNEEIPKFPPTFKFHIGTTEYNMKRRPAWTDRILYRIRDDIFDRNLTKIEQLSYKSHPMYTISDHKPVSGEFRIILAEDPYHGIVEFSYIPVWRLGKENLIQYTIPESFTEDSGDWIGIYPANYGSLTDYVAYEYASHCEKDNNIRYLRVEFSDNVNLFENKDYILLYIQDSGIRSINHVAGISNVFKTEK